MVKASAYNVRDLGSIPGLGRSLGGGHGNPPIPVFLPGESPCTEWAIVPGVTESDMTERLNIAQHRITAVMTEI